MPSPADRAPAMSLIAGDELARLLLDSTGEGIYGVDLRGRCTFANPACVRLLGFGGDADLLGRNMHDLVHHTRPDGDPYPQEECRIYRAFRNREGRHVDDELLFRADGSSFPAEYWSYPVERDGELVGCVVTFADITERRRNEQLVVEQAAALAEVARFPEMNPGPVLRLDLDGNVLLANGAAREVFGDEIVGSCWHDLCPSIDEAWPAVLEATTAVALERQLDHRDYVFTHRHDVESGLVFVFGADISQQKQAERALRQTEKMAALGKLSAGLAHELNNPAAAAGRAASQLDTQLDELQSTTIELARAGIQPDVWQSLIGRSLELRDRSAAALGLSPLEASDREDELGTCLDAHGIDDGWKMAAAFVEAGLRSGDLESIAAALPSDQLGAALVWFCKTLEVHALAATVVRSSRTISDLVAVVKSYSRMDQAPIQQVDIHEGIEDTLTILGHKLRRGIDVLREYDRGVPRVLVPGSELNQVWTNLIDNAIGAMGEAGTLTICTYREDDHVTVDIGDDGTGIPEEIQARIFDPFFTTKNVGEGTGLGLDVVRRIVTERCSGWIDFRSRPGETIFTVSVPVEG